MGAATTTGCSRAVLSKLSSAWKSSQGAIRIFTRAPGSASVSRAVMAAAAVGGAAVGPGHRISSGARLPMGLPLPQRRFHRAEVGDPLPVQVDGLLDQPRHTAVEAGSSSARHC